MADNKRRGRFGRGSDDGASQSIFDLFEPPPEQDASSFTRIPIIRDDGELDLTGNDLVEAQAAAEAEAAGLAHWTEPPTGQVPAALAAATQDDRWADVRGPSWQGEEPNWAGPDLSDVFADTDPITHRRVIELDDASELSVEPSPTGPHRRATRVERHDLPSIFDDGRPPAPSAPVARPGSEHPGSPAVRPRAEAPRSVPAAAPSVPRADASPRLPTSRPPGAPSSRPGPEPPPPVGAQRPAPRAAADPTIPMATRAAAPGPPAAPPRPSADRGPSILDRPADRGPSRSEQPAERGPSILDRPADRGPSRSELPIDRGPSAFDRSVDRAPRPADRPVDRGPSAFDRPVERRPSPLEPPVDRGPSAFDPPVERRPSPLESPVDRGPSAFDRPVERRPSPLERPVDRGPSAFDRAVDRGPSAPDRAVPPPPPPAAPATLSEGIALERMAPRPAANRSPSIRLEDPPPARRGAHDLPPGFDETTVRTSRPPLPDRAAPARPGPIGSEVPAGPGPSRPEEQAPVSRGDLDASGYDPVYGDEEYERGGGFSRRVVVGVALSALVLVALAVGPEATMVLVGLATLLAVVELFNTMRIAGLRPATLLGLVGAVALPAATYVRGEAGYPLVAGLAVVFGMLWYLTGADTERPVLNLGLTITGILWVGGLAGFAALMLRAEEGTGLLLATIIITSVSDILAYLGGRAYGTRPFHSASPNKTWEGTLTGFFGALLAGLAIGVTDLIPVFDRGFVSVMVMAAVIGVLAPIGDLAESLVKRDLGVKDMGSLLPGHGGVMDRIDGLLFALPGAYYAAVIFELIA